MKYYNLNFSVLMSIYKNEHPEYFDKALNSILKDQSLITDDLVLVVDGPISSELEKVIQKYKKEFENIFNIFRLENNVGLGKALNYGLNFCKNNIVARADTDDICFFNRFEKQVKYMFENENVDVCGSYTSEFNLNVDDSFYVRKVPIENVDIYKLAKFRNPINHMSVVFRKDRIIDVGSYEDLLYVEDYYLWAKCMSNNYIFYNIPEPLVYARVGNGMIKRRGNKKSIESYKSLYTYMLKKKLINNFNFIKNMTMIIIFMYMPNNIKEISYNILLRPKKNKAN